MQIVIPPAKTVKISRDEYPQDIFYAWIDLITKIVNQLQPTFGTGSPEGSVIGNVGQVYIDTTTPGTGIYYKESGTGNTGWIARS